MEEDEKTKKYISVDVEASGQYPWSSSMLSLGACVVDGKFDKTFYMELKPIGRGFLYENFKIGASALNCLKGYNFDKFDPYEVFNILGEKGEDPYDAIPKFSDWLKGNSVGKKLVLAAAPIRFDGMFISYYMDKFNEGEDFSGYSGEDMNSVFRGLVHDIDASVKELSMRQGGELRHNALEDAVQEAREFWVSLVNMRQHKNLK